MNKSAQEINSPNERRSQTTEESRAGTIHGVIWAFFCSIIAELALVPVVEANHWHLLESIGRISFCSFGLYVIHHFCSVSFRLYKPSKKNLIFLAASLALTLVLVAIGALLSASLADYCASKSGIKISVNSFYFLLPFATGALLLQSVLGLHYGMVFGVSLALIVVSHFPHSPLLPALVLVTCLVGCMSLVRFRSRSAFTKSGLHISLVAFVMALAAAIMSGSPMSFDSLAILVSALVGGIVCAFLAAGVAPIVEYLGGYITDMRLIEMATIDHPLLKDLSIQAPGTWNHSMVMGMMVEAAADAIGANPVLARVGSYFHDIGKLKKPLYYMENTGGQENRHDKLSPSMSALIIRSHVKDGIELAQEYKLPEAVVDMIPQHHGTARIEYFYDKARKETEENGGDPDSVDESLYRYPGPKPQTREAGILMLADGVEAAARTLAEPTFDRLQGMVQKMINKVFSSGELNECELTLRDLHLIAKNFTRVLNGIYHQRIAYAEPAEKVRVSPQENKNEANSDKGNADKESQELAGESANKKQKPNEQSLTSQGNSSETGSKEDLKRLGITHH